MAERKLVPVDMEVGVAEVAEEMVGAIPTEKKKNSEANMGEGRASPAKQGPSGVHEMLLKPVSGLSFLIWVVKLGKD